LSGVFGNFPVNVFAQKTFDHFVLLLLQRRELFSLRFGEPAGRPKKIAILPKIRPRFPFAPQTRPISADRLFGHPSMMMSRMVRSGTPNPRSAAIYFS
jgi:hypothetical protein